MEKRLLSGRFTNGLSSEKESMPLKQGPARHANTRPTGSLLSVFAVGTPRSPLTKAIQITGEIPTGRTAVGHLALPTLRFYRFAPTDPSGVVAGKDPLTPEAWGFMKKSPAFSPRPFLLNYCFMYMRDSLWCRCSAVPLEWGWLGLLWDSPPNVPKKNE